MGYVYTLLQTNFVSADILCTNFNVPNNPYMFLYFIDV